MKVIVEVFGTWQGSNATVNEIKFLKNKGVVNYNTTEKDNYSSYIKTIDYYWNSSVSWNRHNLNNNNTNNSSDNATGFLYRASQPLFSPVSDWSRFLVDVESDFDEIEVWLGGQVLENLYRTPKAIYFYKLDEGVEYNLSTHLRNRGNIGLIFIGEIITEGVIEIPTAFIIPIIEERPNKYLIQDNDKIKKPIIEGLEEIGNAPVTLDMFEEHGTEDLSLIIGNFEYEAKMENLGEIDGMKILGSKIFGFEDIEILKIDKI